MNPVKALKIIPNKTYYKCIEIWIDPTSYTKMYKICAYVLRYESCCNIYIAK